MASHAKLPSGNYQCTDRYTDPYTGKRIKITVTYSGNTRKAQRNAERELEDKIDAIIAEYEQGSDSEKIIRFLDLEKSWFEHWSAGVNPRTVTREELVLRRVNEMFDPDTLIERITPLHLEKILIDYQKQYNSSYSTMIHIKSTLNKIFKYAVKFKILTYSPMSVVELNMPREKKLEPKTRRRLKYLEPHELNAFLTEIKRTVNPAYYYLTVFLVNTGLRIGEAGALTKDDINFKTRRMSITKSLVKSSRGKFEYGPTKTEESERVVGLSVAAIKSLLAAIKVSESIEERYKIKPWKSYVKTDSIFRTLSGSPITSQSYRRLIRDLQIELRAHCEEKYGFKWVKNITPHSFRFINITYLKDSEGVDLKSIQNHVGHADLRTTMNVYAQATEKSTQNVVIATDHWTDEKSSINFYPDTFHNDYSTRLNKFLRENPDIGMMEITLEEFRKRLEIPNDYQTRHIRNNIIEKVINDLRGEWATFNIETIYGKMHRIHGYRIIFGDNILREQKVSHVCPM